MRTISDIEQRTLKSATDGAYVLSGGISRVLDFTRVGTASLSKYASFNDEFRESFIPIDVAIEVDRRAKTPTIVKEMAAMLGYELRPISQGSECDLAPITEIDAHRVLSIVLELPKEILKALADDDHIDSLERRIIIKKALEAGRAVSDIVQRAEVKI